MTEHRQDRIQPPFETFNNPKPNRHDRWKNFRIHLQEFRLFGAPNEASYRIAVTLIGFSLILLFAGMFLRQIIAR